MITLNQLIKCSRKKKKIKETVPALERCPQKKAICSLVLTITPRKPNSALRKVAKIKLSTETTTFCAIPGVGHNLQKFSTILIRGRPVRDLPGIKYGAIRGKLDLKGVLGRKNGRSKYGVKFLDKKLDIMQKKRIIKRRNKKKFLRC